MLQSELHTIYIETALDIFVETMWILNFKSLDWYLRSVLERKQALNFPDIFHKVMVIYCLQFQISIP